MNLSIIYNSSCLKEAMVLKFTITYCWRWTSVHQGWTSIEMDSGGIVYSKWRTGKWMMFQTLNKTGKQNKPGSNKLFVEEVIVHIVTVSLYLLQSCFHPWFFTSFLNHSFLLKFFSFRPARPDSNIQPSLTNTVLLPCLCPKTFCNSCAPSSLHCPNFTATRPHQISPPPYHGGGCHCLVVVSTNVLDLKRQCSRAPAGGAQAHPTSPAIHNGTRQPQ